jgi:hypothetical protein
MQELFPLEAVIGRIWKNTAGQLSFLRHAVSAPPEIFSFAHSSRKQVSSKIYRGVDSVSLQCWRATCDEVCASQTLLVWFFCPCSTTFVLPSLDLCVHSLLSCRLPLKDSMATSLRWEPPIRVGCPSLSCRLPLKDSMATNHRWEPPIRVGCPWICLRLCVSWLKWAKACKLGPCWMLL